MDKTIEQHRDITYHANCEMWYIAAAAKMTNELTKKRALEKAEYHHRHVDYLRGLQKTRSTDRRE